MNGSKCLYGLAFDVYALLDKEGIAVTAIEFQVLVNERQYPFAFETKAPAGELFRQALGVAGYKQARPQVALHLHRCANDLLAASVLRERHSLLASSISASLR
jgi:hypothetical protein